MKSLLKRTLATVAALSIVLVPYTAVACEPNDCLDPNDKASYVGTLSRGTGTIATRDGKPLCSDGHVTLQSFTMPKTWDGKGWNQTAIPQYKYGAAHVTIPGGVANATKSATVATPANCDPTQLDWYVGSQELPAIINYHDGEDREIIGRIFNATETCEVPVEKTITVCDLASMTVISIKESAFDTRKHSKDTAACKKPEVKKIQVCDLTSKNVITIDEKTFDSTKHSKDLNACVKTEQPKQIKVCELATKNIITINEQDFVAAKHSKDLNSCAVTPAPVQPTPSAPQPLQTPAVLPNTGTGAVAAVFGITSMLGTLAYRFVLRFGRSS